MSRRGENIFQRKDGLWEARYVKGVDEFGKKKYASVYAHSYKEVKEKRLEVMSNLSFDNRTWPKSTTTLANIICEWLYLNQHRLKPASWQKYNNIFIKHIKNQIGNYPVIQISPSIMKRYADDKLCTGLSANTVNGILVFIHTCLKYANRQYGLPLIEIIYLKEPKKEMRVFSVEEQECLTRFLINETDIYKLGVLVAMYTGIRIGELCALKWKDVSNGIITINKTMQRLQKGGESASEIVVDDPKSESSIRKIPIPDFLEEYIEKFRLSDENNFISRLYHPVVEPRVLQYQFKKYLKICGIESATFHTLRHTFATRCVECEVDIKTLSCLLGHSEASITLNKYVHSSFEQKVVSMNKLKLML